MQRTCMRFLEEWLISPIRKPLVIRGARQVGKTWIVRNLAQTSRKALVEINFEKTPQYAVFFESNDPKIILRKLEEAFDIKIDLQNTILFLDEIQAKPELFGKLRWFYEDMPELPVVAAGSLLEFVLGTHLVKMPVGRISFMYLEPMSFIEFLQAQKKDMSVKFIQSYVWNTEIDLVLHDKLMSLFKEYVFVGGLPQAVSRWAENKSLSDVKRIQQDLLATYRSDFDKYGGSTYAATLNDVLDAVPYLLGKKFVYSKVESTSTSVKIKETLNQLTLARVVHIVRATAANGIPLGAEVNYKFLKAILLDAGLCSTILNLKLNTLEEIEELDMINKGGVAEQVVGQLLRTLEECYIEPSLYYWLRTEPGSDAEIDYVIQHNAQVIPIEVKAGGTGNLRSLHLFMRSKKLKKAVRIYSGAPLINDINTKDNLGNEVRYQLRSLPFYLLSEVYRLLD